jgi:hypothetical protein
MAAEIGAQVTISKEIEVTVMDVPEASFRAQADKRHGSRDSRRTSAKDHPKAQTYPVVADSPRSFVSAASTSTPSSLDSTSSLVTDFCSLASDYSPLSSPSLPTSSPLSNDEIVHGDDSLLVFPMLTDCLPRCPTPANSHISGEESIIGNNHLDAIPEKSLTSAERGLDARELHQVQFEGDVEAEPAAIVVTAIDAWPDPDELLLAALGKLGVAASPSVPEGPKRRIVEAFIIRELDQEEGFLDFSSF